MSERLNPVRLRPLIAEAWHELRRTAHALWLVWLLHWAASAAIALTLRTFRSPDAAFGGETSERLWTLGLGLLTDALVGALALPVLLRDRDRATWPDRQRLTAYLGAFLLLNGAAALAGEGAGNILSALSMPWPAQLIGAVATLLGVAAIMTCWLMWPIGQLANSGPKTAAEAFQMMRGHVGVYLVADFAVALLPILFYWMAAAEFDAYETLLPLALGMLAMTFCTAWFFAVSAVFYRRRLGLTQRELAAMFD